MRHISEYIECGVTGITTGLVVNDVEDGDADPQTPPGWITLVAVRVVKNPDHKPTQSADEILAAQLANIDEAQRAQARRILEPYAKMQAEAGDVEPEFIVQECTIHVHPEAAEQVLALDRDAFEDAGWLDEAGQVDQAAEAPSDDE